MKKGTHLTGTKKITRTMKTDHSVHFTISWGFGVFLSLVTTVAAALQPYPDKPVTIAVPFSPGGGTDIGARLIAQKLIAKWGQTIIVDNRRGAGGFVGADLVAKAKSDGYILLVGNVGTQAIKQSFDKMPYAADITPASRKAIIERDRARYGKVIINRAIKV